MDGDTLKARLNWVAVPGSEFLYAEVDPGIANGTHTVSANTSIKLLAFRLGQTVGFGTAAACSHSG